MVNFNLYNGIIYNGVQNSEKHFKSASILHYMNTFVIFLFYNLVYFLNECTECTEGVSEFLQTDVISRHRTKRNRFTL